jgi:hypothetical protein
VSFEDTLVSILENRPSHSEVVVVHAQRYDDPYGLRNEVRFVQCAADSELELINTGFHRAEGDIVHVLRCGIQVTARWSDSAVEQFESEFVGAVAPVILSSESSDSDLGLSGWDLTSTGRRKRRREGSRSTTCTAPPLDAGFFRRQPVLDLGGFDLDIQCVADLELGLALAQLGLDCLADDHCKVVQKVFQAASDEADLDEFELAKSLEILHHRNTDGSSRWFSKVVRGASLASDLLRGRWARLRGRISGWRHHERHERETYRARIDEVLGRMEERANVLPFCDETDEESADYVKHRRAA